ncbi:sensor histidine kinase [Actinomadura rugatobispora]|uniref:histidine kinase n=1 Tax=Actinomadura rugatobispora TaxID=1994 RepID=A0ABW1AHW3_9ACTN|nr:HAMP domain-containing sensor histidine kinase [Actinomadura rugatobispora]
MRSHQPAAREEPPAQERPAAQGRPSARHAARAAARTSRLRLPNRTVRLRLTLLYGALFLVCGTALLAITYVLMDHATADGYIYKGKDNSVNAMVGSPEPPQGYPPVPEGRQSQSGQLEGVDPNPAAEQPMADARTAELLAKRQHEEQMHQLIIQSGIALGIMTVISIGLGWIVAGRILHRLRTITAAARDISATNLHERLALDGPRDELKELGDTFDELLARLESSFLTQRQFIANASHELRTPLARQRTVAQVALSDPGATADTLREAHERVLAAGAQQERLIAALLTLARGQAGLSAREPFDLARLTEEVVIIRQEDAEQRGLRIGTRFSPATAVGDPRLAERLIVNLVDNALRHNVPDGHVRVGTGVRDGRPVLTVVNTGPVVPADAVDRLFRPFERLGAERTRKDGLGLGMPIVRAVADAHDAGITVEPRPGGGLEITVSFQAPDPPAPAHRRAPSLANGAGPARPRA